LGGIGVIAEGRLQIADYGLWIANCSFVNKSAICNLPSAICNLQSPFCNPKLVNYANRIPSFTQCFALGDPGAVSGIYCKGVQRVAEKESIFAGR
jgi:hypothetical protein